MVALDGLSWRRFKTLLSGITSMPNSALVNRLSSRDERDSGGPRRSPNSYTITANSDPQEVRAFFHSIAVPKQRARGRRRRGRR